MKNSAFWPATAAFLAFIAVIFCGWYSGLDFTVRGPSQGGVMLFAILCSCAAGFVVAAIIDIRGNL